ncbi:MAG: hypothetical protein ACRD3C_12930 [Vicinamibacterales bacterium]
MQHTHWKTVGPFLPALATIGMLALPSPLLGQAPERRAERASYTPPPKWGQYAAAGV